MSEVLPHEPSTDAFIGLAECALVNSNLYKINYSSDNFSVHWQDGDYNPLLEANAVLERDSLFRPFELSCVTLAFAEQGSTFAISLSGRNKDSSAFNDFFAEEILAHFRDYFANTKKRSVYPQTFSGFGRKILKLPKVEELLFRYEEAGEHIYEKLNTQGL